jgi:hypothetical protein
MVRYLSLPIALVSAPLITYNPWQRSGCKIVAPIVFSTHALAQMADRGANEAEVERTVREGEEIPANYKQGRRAFRKNFPFNSEWKGRHYELKQVMPVIADETDRLVVITVYVFYFGGNP